MFGCIYGNLDSIATCLGDAKVVQGKAVDSNEVDAVTPFAPRIIQRRRSLRTANARAWRHASDAAVGV